MAETYKHKKISPENLMLLLIAIFFRIIHWSIVNNVWIGLFFCFICTIYINIAQLHNMSRNIFGYLVFDEIRMTFFPLIYLIRAFFSAVSIVCIQELKWRSSYFFAQTFFLFLSQHRYRFTIKFPIGARFYSVFCDM